jgi:hypothetical protein
MTLLTGLVLDVLTSPVLLAECIICALVIYVSGIALYRLTLHPLARYPGPFLAKITDLYLAYHAWKGDRHLEFWRCHEKYGSSRSFPCDIHLLIIVNRRLCCSARS